MKGVILVVAVMGSLVGPAEAVVCARGIYRAGCVGPNGAVAVRRGYAGGAAYWLSVGWRGGVVVRRTVVRRH